MVFAKNALISYQNDDYIEMGISQQFIIGATRDLTLESEESAHENYSSLSCST